MQLQNFSKSNTQMKEGWEATTFPHDTLTLFLAFQF